MWTLKKVFISQYLKVLEVILKELRETEKLGQKWNCQGLSKEESRLVAEQSPHALVSQSSSQSFRSRFISKYWYTVFRGKSGGCKLRHFKVCSDTIFCYLF